MDNNHESDEMNVNTTSRLPMKSSNSDMRDFKHIIKLMNLKLPLIIRVPNQWDNDPEENKSDHLNRL